MMCNEILSLIVREIAKPIIIIIIIITITIIIKPVKQAKVS